MIFVLVLLALSVLLTGLILTLPGWFARTLMRDRIWRLRDRLVEDIVINDQLPKHHPAVHQLLQDIDWTLRQGKHFTLKDLYLAERSLRGLDRTKLEAELRAKPLTGLTPDQRKLLTTYRRRYDNRLAALMLLGSWVGLGIFASRVPAAWLRMRRESPTPRTSVTIEVEVRRRAQRVTDRTVEATTIGKQLPRWSRDVKASAVLAAREQERASELIATG